jgi:hypothetical protein
MFWWNWWVQVAVAVGTIGAVLLALFGQAFRAKFFPPKLTLQLDQDSELSYEGEEKIPARYYHLRVANSRRWSPTHEVRVVLLEYWEPGPDGRLQLAWQGDIPFGWRHQAVFPLLRTIGGKAYADLCSVRKDVVLRIHVLIRPYNLKTERKEKSTLVLTLQARGVEADSNVLRIRIIWDGGWHDGEAEMRRHLIVEEMAGTIGQNT